MADPLTLAALGLSAVTLAAVLTLLVTGRRRGEGTASDPGDLAGTIREVKGSVSDLHQTVSQLSSEVGKIAQATNSTSEGMIKMREFAELLTGSAQKRGAAGEVVVSAYLEGLPQEMWERQFHLPGSMDRVDYALRINDGGKRVYLPIDAKFSLPSGAEDFAKEANVLALKRADEVRKYIMPGTTTDFAVMVLPSSVYYALGSETVGTLQDARVVACPPEGVIILSSLAMRAHQAFVLAQSAERLRDYVQVIGVRLEGIGDEMAKLAKHLRGATKYAEESLRDIEGTKSALDGISTRLELGTDEEPGLDQFPTASPVLGLERKPEEEA